MQKQIYLYPDFPRGIFTTIVVKTKVALEEIIRMYEEYYAKDSFTFVVEKNIDLKQVVIPINASSTWRSTVTSCLSFPALTTS